MMQMEKRKNKRIIAAVLLPVLLVVALLSGCGRLRASTGTGTYFDTVVDIRIYDRKGDELLEKCNVVGTPGSGFGKMGEGYLRLTGFGSRERTIEAVERIKKTFGK